MLRYPVPSFRVEYQTSPILYRGTMALFAIIVLALIAYTPEATVSAGLVTLLAAWILKRLKKQQFAIEVQANGQCYWLHKQQKQAIFIQQETWFCPFLVILVFKTEAQTTHRLALWQSGAEAESYRQLHLYLRWFPHDFSPNYDSNAPRT